MPVKAIQIQAHGDYDKLQIVDLPKPEPEAGKVLVRMTHAGINPVDNDVRLGRIPFAKQPPIILGTEGAGMVEHGTDKYPEGTRVIVYGGLMGVVQDGVWREYINVDPVFLRAIPPGAPTREAASISMVYLTAGAALEQGGLKQGMTALVTTVGGGVGNAAYQLALLQGATTLIGTTGSPQKQEQARKFVDKLFQSPLASQAISKVMPPATKMFELHRATRDHIIDLSKESLEERVKTITGGHGVDFIVDTIGGDYFMRLIALAAPGGTIASVGYKAGLDAKINIMPILANQLRIFGTNVFNLGPDISNSIMNRVLQYLVSQQIHPAIDSSFPLKDVVKACQRQSEATTFGKVILELE
jgi:NADPH:quinone reductase